MKKAIDLITLVVTHAPKIKYYALLVVQVVDMLDGVKDWQLNNAPVDPAPKKK